jgi:hypothetical protein
VVRGLGLVVRTHARGVHVTRCARTCPSRRPAPPQARARRTSPAASCPAACPSSLNKLE